MTPTKPAQVFEFTTVIQPVAYCEASGNVVEIMLKVSCKESDGLALEELRGQSVKVTIESVDSE